MSFLRPPNLTQLQRILVLLGVYSVVLIAATWVAYGLRFDFEVPEIHERQFGAVWPWVWASKLVVLAAAGQFSSLLSFFSLPDLKRLGVALGLITVGMLGLWHVGESIHSMSRGVIVLDGVLSFLGVAACRLIFRLIRQGTGEKALSETRRIAIVGAGEVGANLARELQTRGGLKPAVFFDDALRKTGTQVHGIPVRGAVELLGEAVAPEIDEVIIAMPSAPGKRVRAIVEYLGRLKIPCRTVPSMSQLAEGEIISALRPVEIGDVLGREPADLEVDGLENFYAGECVLVTGAGGSIGSELCRQLVRCGVSRLILLERSESALFDIDSELAGETDCVPELLDITDSQRLSQVLDQYRPAAVFHAAAFKHVGLLERQPLVALRNNILGTHILAKLAREHQVDRVVLISTDKAVEPTNVMGATKRVAERLMEGHALDSSGTRFISVRFGNVLGSSGSVVPIFQRQIAIGGPVTVRDAEVTRYFMSIPEAAGLVLCSGMLGGNGDRFILNMGEPVKIMDLAEQMIRLSGKTPGQEIAIEITGLGPGEKQHERLHASDEQLEASTHSKIQRIRGDRLDADAWRHMQSQLALLEALNGADAIAWLQDTLPEYQAE